jgi:hypothetical protein
MTVCNYESVPWNNVYRGIVEVYSKSFADITDDIIPDFVHIPQQTHVAGDGYSRKLRSAASNQDLLSLHSQHPADKMPPTEQPCLTESTKWQADVGYGSLILLTLHQLPDIQISQQFQNCGIQPDGELAYSYLKFTWLTWFGTHSHTPMAALGWTYTPWRYQVKLALIFVRID